MTTSKKRVVCWTRTVVITAVLFIGAMDVAPLSALPASAQVKSIEDAKALVKPDLPAGAQEITAAMKSAKVGETITIRGSVAMSNDAFGTGAATFTLVDDTARSIPTPAGDARPESSDANPAASRATVRVLGADGTLLKGTLNGRFGLKAGAEVFVTGKVETADGVDALVLTAASIHVPRSPLPSGFFVEQAPENAKDVSEARKEGSLKTGDEVVLRGRIGGSKEPFVAGRAVFTLMGRGLKACNENPDDTCSAPWDYCCETKEDILSHSVTVQVVDAKGQILRTAMKGRRGLKELSEIVVIGKVTSADGKAVVVNASSISVVR
ncbi:MAG TPA: hypothetical protein VHN77_14815 [Phycisphaerales bacterium]|nr:hypothetical protein [Phycisphaerales bacterium]